MKKLIVAILAFLYLGVSSGIAMEIHYCMGEKAGVGFYGSDDDKCGKCGMKAKKSGCCKDEHKFYKINDSHKNVSNELSLEIPVLLVEHAFAVYQLNVPVTPTAKDFNNHSPPDYTGPAACIMNCTFRL